MKPLLFLALLLPLLGGCQETAKNFLGRTGTIVLRQPTKIEAWRIHGGQGTPEIASPAKELNVDLARQLAALMLDSKTYSFDSAKGCMFEPAVGFRIWRDKRSIDVILCFHCTELKLVSPDPVSPKYPSRTEDFDNARPAMINLVKQAFPDDKEIQELK